MKVGLRCPRCKVGRRHKGEIELSKKAAAAIGSEPIVYTCDKGHAYAFRRLTRDERRRSGKSAPEWVATEWEGSSS